LNAPHWNETSPVAKPYAEAAKKLREQ